MIHYILLLYLTDYDYIAAVGTTQRYDVMFLKCAVNKRPQEVAFQFCLYSG